jgi:cellulose synthase/poly-beta-1,6-N-acetylglucosamine synthase-like glycosyltransferase
VSVPGRRVLVVASGIALVWPLVLYPSLLWLVARARPASSPADPSSPLPSITIILPTYNEISNIRPRLENLAACAYPAELLSIIVVDSASSDGTAAAAEAFAATRTKLSITVLREDHRKGKAAATNFALRFCRSSLILVTDAPTRFDPQAIQLLARRFNDPQVGAATGRFVIFESRTATQREEGLFWRIRNLLRNLEADVDSTPFLSGEMCCFRRSLIDYIDTDSIADDMNVALRVRRLGYRATVEPQALYTEPRSPKLDDLLVRKVSRAAGGVQELLRHRDMALNPRYGFFGMVILPTDLLYYTPVRIPALAVLGAALLPFAKRRAFPLAAVAATAIAVPPIRRRLADVAYVALLNEWLFLRGWQMVLKRETEVLWEQERRDVIPGSDWSSAVSPSGEPR